MVHLVMHLWSKAAAVTTSCPQRPAAAPNPRALEGYRVPALSLPESLSEVLTSATRLWRAPPIPAPAAAVAKGEEATGPPVLGH